MSIEHQIVQKLHACTGSGTTLRNDRAHDLVDLQILVRESPDFAVMHDLATRVFAFRRTHTWPPTVRPHHGWDELYAAAASGLPVLGDVESAIVWANDLVRRITRSDGS